MARLLKIAVDDDKLQAKLTQLAGADMKPAFEAVGRVIATRVRLCFKLGVDPWGSPWAAIKWRAPRRTNDGKRLSQTGKRQAAANAAGKAGQPLRDTGRLNRSITSVADSNGVTVGTNVQYARTHQFGATIVPKHAKRLVFPGPDGAMIFAKKVTVPARPFLPLRPNAAVVALPPDWSLGVVRALRLHFRRQAKQLDTVGA